jgi:glucosyl-3-phosphoglycerate phosphatase
VGAGRILLWRHGRTAYNASARLQGQIDIPLDDVGRWQARTAAARIVMRHEPATVVSSDLARARQTAECLTGAAGVGLELDERLRERAFGEWEGLTGDEIHARWPEEYALWRGGGDPPRVGAESRAEVASRLGAAVRDHVEKLDRSQTLVLVSHGAAISSAVAELLGMSAEWRGVAGMHNAHWAELVAARNDVMPAWRLVGYNLGPTDASSDWNAGPDRATDTDPDTETRDPD